MPPLSGLQRGLTFFNGRLTADGNPMPGTQVYQLVRKTHPSLSTTHIDTMYAAALAGLGIAGLPSYVIEDALVENALERVLPEWRLFEVTLWVGMPSRRFLPARTPRVHRLPARDLRRPGPRPLVAGGGLRHGTLTARPGARRWRATPPTCRRASPARGCRS